MVRECAGEPWRSVALVLVDPLVDATADDAVVSTGPAPD